MGHDLYVHKDYVKNTTIPPDVYDKAKQSLELNHPGFEYNIVKHNKQTNNVSFLHSPDWDTTHEPHIKHSVHVKPNGDTKYMAPKKDPQIYHQKWQFVGDDYKGFDVERSKLRTKQYTKTINDLKTKTGDNSISKKIGTKSYWDREVVPHIKENNLKTFKQLIEDIANVTGTPTTDTNGVSTPATATPDKKKKVMLLKNVIKRKEDSPNG